MADSCCWSVEPPNLLEDLLPTVGKHAGSRDKARVGQIGGIAHHGCGVFVVLESVGRVIPHNNLGDGSADTCFVLYNVFKACED